MKFPTTAPMFPPVALSPTECTRYEQLAKALVDDTLAAYDLYNDVQQRQVSKKLWKVIKSRENITVYKDRTYDSGDNVHRGLATGIAVSESISSDDEMTPSQQQQRGHAASTASQSSSSHSSSLPAAILDSIPAGEWNLPELLMAGTLAGTLDEVMYGISTPDPGLILLKAYYSQDEVVDGQVLAQIHGPSPAEPFRFLGLKWLVKGNPPGVNALVLPRDLVLLESTGTMTHPVSGERIGYFMMHSVDVPTCPELPKKSVIRAHLSTCYIFRQLPNNVVDIYMKGFFELAGRIADPIAIVSAANGLLCCWKSVVCAQSKKLVWLLKHKSREENKRRLVAGAHQQKQLAPNCGMCAKSFKMYNRVACCQLCDGTMCSRCRVSVKLAFPRPGEKDIRLKSVVLCKGCITNCSQQSTLDIAQQEVLSGRFGSLYSSSSSSRASAASTASTARASSDTVGTSNTSTVFTADSEDVGGSSMADTTKSAEFSAYYSDGDCENLDDDVRPSEDDALDFVDVDGVVTSDWSAVSPTARQQYLDSVQGRTPEEQAMWKRMAQLHLQAESLYQFTKKNTETLFHGNPVAGVTSTRGTEVLMPPAAPALQRSLSHRMSID